MTLLVCGLILFLGAHLLPGATRLRGRVIARIGEGPYKGLMSLVSLAGFVLIIIGEARATFVPIYAPPGWGPTAAAVLMLPVFALLIAAYVPTNVRRYTRHPMLWAVVFWAAAHLLANGDVASLLLFGLFGLWALYDMASANLRGAALVAEPLPLWRDALVVAAGLVLYFLVAALHATLFGPAVPRLA